MGATSFFTTATGKTVREAYKSAVDDAYYWNGHGGYTGTIAEKSGFIEFSVPLAELPTRDDERDEVTRSGIVSVKINVSAETRLANAIYWYQSNRWSWSKDWSEQTEQDPFTTPEDVEVMVPSWVRESDRDAYVATQRQREADSRADALFLATKMGRRAWERMCEQFDRKWDEAVAIKMGDNEWLFCGIASC